MDDVLGEVLVHFGPETGFQFHFCVELEAEWGCILLL
jgi:hypothetical protein